MSEADDFVAVLRKFKGQYAHMVPIMGGFAVVVMFVFVAKLLDQVGAQSVGVVLMTIVGTAFLAIVLAGPRLWKRWTGQRALRLSVRGGEISLDDPAGGKTIASGVLTEERFAIGEFHYDVTTGGSGGRFRAPLLTLRFAGSKSIHVGAEGSELTWGGELEVVSRPHYILDAREWEALVDRIGMAVQLTRVDNSRVI
jgi:hypothetical protein